MAKRTTRSPSSPGAGPEARPDDTQAFATRSTGMPDSARDAGVPAGSRTVSMASEPTEEEIRRRAYQRFLERGATDGRDFDDWLEAERELKGL